MSVFMPEAKPAADPKPDAPKFEFGPDSSATPPHPPKLKVPKVNQDNPPRKSPLSNLGTNKKLRSPVRKLTREAPKQGELSDLERLIGWYERIGKILRVIHPKVAAALVEQAEDCATSWFDLAENNDTVRRYILGIIEGGDWGRVFAAHAPIFLALLPERTIERIMMRGFAMFAQQSNEDADQFDETWPEAAR